MYIAQDIIQIRVHRFACCPFLAGRLTLASMEKLCAQCASYDITETHTLLHYSLAILATLGWQPLSSTEKEKHMFYSIVHVPSSRIVQWMILHTCESVMFGTLAYEIRRRTRARTQACTHNLSNLISPLFLSPFSSPSSSLPVHFLQLHLGSFLFLL